MKKLQKKPDSDSAAPQPIKAMVNEMDADELVHQNRDDEPVDATFDVDEAVHKVKRNTNIEPARKTDIDDLIHENGEEDDESIH